MLYEEPLTDRENSILHLIARGLSNQEIADDLVISLGTVKWYNRQIFHKLGVRSRAQAMVLARQRELLPATPDGEVLRHNLPVPLTSFIGREQEVADIKQRLQTARLVTLTGPGGIGKSRLAQQVAVELAGDLVDHVWRAPLGCVEDAALVPGAIADAMGLGEVTSLPQMLKNVLAHQTGLLVVENFEHLMSAAPLLTDLLAAMPGLRLLVTSREVLHLSAEHVYPVAPLSLPYAVTLFIERAQAVKPGFQPNDLSTINLICDRLDNKPLAIELAAALIRILSPQELLTRLEEYPLMLLEGGPRDWPCRHQTLRAAIDWSYNLLTPAEQRLFEQLTIFHVGCTVEAAEAVCQPGMDVLDGLTSLYDKSLIQTEIGPDGETRFTMLGMIRAYARERLEAQPDLPLLRQRYTQYYLGLVTCGQVPQCIWPQRLSAEYDNLRAIMDRSFGPDGDDGIVGAEMVAKLSAYWRCTGHLVEGRRWMSIALAHTNHLPSELRAQLMDQGQF